MSDCTCTCSWDTDAPDAYAVKDRVARRAHHCCECGADIRPGDRYQYISGIWDGSPASFHTCLTCTRIRRDLCDCAPLGEMREIIWEELGFDYVTGEDADEEGD